MFFYHIDVPRHNTLFGRNDKIVLWGACFAQELMKHLYEELYDVVGSPYGIMYNPLSIAYGMERLLDGDEMRHEELFYHMSEWHSFMHHGDYSNADKKKAYAIMRRDFECAQKTLKQASLLVLTFGTAYVYETLDLGQVVNNCHRLPTKKTFSRRRLSVDEIVMRWCPLMGRLRQVNPQLQILFTVSPICHYRDGAHDNRVSKAVLHLAVDELLNSEKEVYYFPAYEIMQDELRDYRFYKEDMVHPSEQAVCHILDRFGSAYLNDVEGRNITEEWRVVKGMLRHKPLTSDRASIQKHYRNVHKRLVSIREKLCHPFLDEQIDVVNSKMRKMLNHE